MHTWDSRVSGRPCYAMGRPTGHVGDSNSFKTRNEGGFLVYGDCTWEKHNRCLWWVYSSPSKCHNTNVNCFFSWFHVLFFSFCGAVFLAVQFLNAFCAKYFTLHKITKCSCKQCHIFHDTHSYYDSTDEVTSLATHWFLYSKLLWVIF